MNMDIGHGSVITGDIIPYGTPTENCKDSDLNYPFLIVLVKNLSIQCSVDNVVDNVDNVYQCSVDKRKIYLKPTRKQLIQLVN